MTKKAKRTVSMLLAGMLTLYSAAPVAAVDSMNADANAVLTSADKAALFDVLDYVESQKELFGLGDVDFSELEIGVVPTYEYVSTGLEECDPIYPLFYDGEVVAIAERVVLDEIFYQISTGVLVDALNASFDDSVSLIYDADGVHLYDGETFEKVISDISSNRLSLMENSNVYFTNTAASAATVDIAGLDTIISADLHNVAVLDYIAAPFSNTATYTCDVDYVDQAISDGSTSKICWAASMACVINYVKSRAYSAEQVAINVWKEMNDEVRTPTIDEYNVSVEPAFYDDYLRDIYGLDYYCYSVTVLTDSIVESNLQKDKPVIVNFVTTSSGKPAHAMVAYSITRSQEHASFMDPNVGFRTAFYTTAPDGAIRYVYTSSSVKRYSQQYIAYSDTIPDE